MTIVDRWTGREARLLREALRLSVRDFVARLGIGLRTVNKWEARQSDITPLPHMQEVLDTTLARASDEAKARFSAATRGAALEHETARSPESPLRDAMLPVVVNGRLVFVPFDADRSPSCAAKSDKVSVGECGMSTSVCSSERHPWPRSGSRHPHRSLFGALVAQALVDGPRDRVTWVTIRPRISKADVERASA